jgi:(2Fe-2S) ferredoxin
MHEISYNMYRLLDTVMMGGNSVKTIPESVLYNLNMKQVAQIVNSAIAQGRNVGSLDSAQVSRIMANVKSDLLSKGLLREECS